MPSSRKILVVGSSNTDMVIQTSHFPAPGETILGGDFFMNPGGKGANQAVAAARLGGEVTFVCRVGDDLFGRQAREQFSREGMDTRFVITDANHPSGVALITLDKAGENSIVVASGANGHLSAEDLSLLEGEIGQYAYMLTQLETPLSAVKQLAQLSQRHQVPLILNPAPAQALDDELLAKLYAITPNETEAALLTGIAVTDVSSARAAAAKLRERGVEVVIITLGARGAYLSSSVHDELIPAPKVAAKDTTAAGDTFNGALTVALGEGAELPEAIAFANRAAAISVTRLGAQASVPQRSELAV